MLSKLITVVSVLLAGVIVNPAPSAWSVPPDSGQATVDCPPADTAVPDPYAVTGTFMYPRSRPCAWRTELTRFHRLGGDTIVQFAPQLLPRGISDGQILKFKSTTVDPSFEDCQDGETTCYRAALAAVQAINSGNTIANVYAYATADAFTDSIMSCADVDKKIAVTVQEPDGYTHTRLYWRLLMPVNENTAGGACRGSATATAYNLVLVAGEENNSLGTLLTEADTFGMRVFAPMPAFPSPDGANGGVYTGHLPAFTAFDLRVLRDYARHYSGHPSFAGVYQTREYFLKPGWTAYLDAYRAQHRRVHAILPGRKVMTSPYWAVFRYIGDTMEPYPNATTPADVEESVVQIYQTGVDIVAVQDGRGGGQTGLFWPYEAGQQVDKRLAEKVGKRTYAQAYRYRIEELYAAAARARDRVSASGPVVELWTNLEAFEPGAMPVCGAGPLHRTDKPRLDQALTHVGTSVSKVISYTWDHLFTCADPTAPPLAVQIAADNDRPVISAAFSFTSNGSRGIALNGYHFGAATVTLTWYDAAWQVRSQQIVVADSGWYDPLAGQRNAKLPDPMEAAWVPFGWTDLAPNFWIHITVTNGTGKATTHRYSLGY